MIFYTTDFDKNANAVQKEDLLQRLKSFELTTQQGSAQAARSESGQSELYQTFHEDGYTIQFVGIRASGATRLIGAVVTGFNEAHHFALELTETHDYRKTLVDNTTRLANWKERLLQFIPYISSIQKTLAHEPDATLETKVKIRHNKIIKLNPQQDALDEGSLEQITFCFGPPGTGKTLIVTGFLERCILAERPTLFIGPENKLIQFVQEALHTRLSETQRRLAHCHTWHSFLTLLVTEGNLPLHLVYDNSLEKEKRIFVTSDVLYTFLCPSHTPPKRTKALLKKYSKDSLFQEYQHVLLQPVWERPDYIFLSLEDYQGLGILQSRIPKQDRAEIYQILHEFYSDVCDSSKGYYDPILATKHIYLHLLTNPFKKFGAIAIDETQRFNPLQTACLLSTASIEEGYALVASDPLQNIDSQPLAFLRPLEDYFAFNHLSRLLHITHLEITHRSSILVTQLTKIWRNALLNLVGPDEIRTFSQMRLDERQAMGKITMAQYDGRLKAMIESNPTAMVLVPNRETATHSWALSHLTTLNEFQGLSAKTIVLDGLSEIYTNELNALTKILDGHENPFEVDEPIVPARHFKSETPLPLEAIKAIKAFIIALSRAEEELILINPHPILVRMVNYLQKKYTKPIKEVASAVTTTAAASVPAAQAKVYSTREWFNRLKQYMNDQLIPQACDLLNRADIWGEHTSAINALGRALVASGLNINELITQMKTILFPAPPLSLPIPQAVAVSSEGPQSQISDACKPQELPDDLNLLWETKYKAKWMNFAVGLVKNPIKENVIKLFDLRDIALINCIFFVQVCKSHYPLFSICLHNDSFKNVIETNPAHYCSKIKIQGLLLPWKIMLSPTVGFTSNGLVALSEDEGIQLFSYIITHNPALSKQITGNILCSPYHSVSLTDMPTTNQSILRNLCADTDDQLVLLQLLSQNPGLAREISVEALMRCPQVFDVNFRSFSSAACLFLSMEGVNILLVLISENPEFVFQFNRAILQEDEVAVDKYTCVATLATTENSFRLFSLLLQLDPDFALLITNEILDTKSYCAPYPSLRTSLSTCIVDNPHMERYRLEINARLAKKLDLTNRTTTSLTFFEKVKEEQKKQEEKKVDSKCCCSVM